MRETMKVLGAALLGAGAVTWGGTAHAQQQQQLAPFFTGANDPSTVATTHPDVGEGDGSWHSGSLAAPTQALELKVAGGYTQGFGMIMPGVGMPSVAGAGVGGNAELDYRMGPHASVGVQGQYQEFTSEQNSASRGLAGNIGFTYHGAPYQRADPWFRFGSGYRLLWSVNPIGPNGNTLPTTLVHGFELGALNLGIDLRLNEGIAISPMIGADLNLFVWENADGINRALSSAQVATFVFAGLQGRFDAGSSKGPGATYAKAPATQVTW